ncbi:MAG: hypothetical protein AAF497_06670, partial [Planctomycetota bacterium]
RRSRIIHLPQQLFGILICPRGFILFYERSHNLPSSMQVSMLDEVDASTVATLVKQYESSRTDENSKELLRQMYDSASSAIQGPLLTELVNVDAARSSEAGNRPTLSDYEKDFPNGDDRRKIKKVLRQNGTLPFLNGRQIFLFMALLTIPVFVYAYRNHPWITAAGQESGHESVE